MFANLLAPMPLEQFLSEYWTRRFLHIPGPPDKLADLFPWHVLNQVLERHRLPSDRLVLMKAGRPVQSSRYRHADMVDAAGLTSELAAGATLILNFCEELHPPLRDLCNALERLFHVDVYANLYAGWRQDNGFDVHWDDQDNLILQIAGRKHWKVWAPTRAYPFKDDVVDTSTKTRPTGPPLWEGTLEPGGLLNMPRGWWHVAHPLNEPCLHVTVTVKSLDGVGFLRWVAYQLKTSDAARAPVPILASDEERAVWLDTIWRDLRDAWTPDLFDRFLAHVDRRARPRPSLRLPTVSPSASSVVGDTRVQLALPRPLIIQTRNGTARFAAKDTRWETTSDLAPALRQFNDGLAHTAAELCPEGHAKLAMLLTALVMKGVFRIADPD